MSFIWLKNIIVNTLFPIQCLGCGKENIWICDDCKKNLTYNPNYLIEKNALPSLDGVFVVFDYNDKLIKKLIKNLKYNLIKDIGCILGSLAYDFMENKISFKTTVIIPVPLHKKRENWRGFNQAEIIASSIINLSNKRKGSSLPFNKNLKKIKNTKPQAKLDKKMREKNIKNSFIWTGDNLKGADILLIDDVLTTGSTLNECASVLKKAGAGKVRALVIAHG